MLYKATGGDTKRWFWALHHVAWADRITVRKVTGCSPYFLVTGAQPTIPLDIAEATWLVKYPAKMISSSDLIGLRAQALAKHISHVEDMRQRVSNKKLRRALQLEEDMKHKIKEFKLEPGDLALVLNSAVEMSADRKMKTRYLGPVIIVKRLKGGAYIVAEFDGSVWQNKVAAYRVVPYLARQRIEFGPKIQELLDTSGHELEVLEKEENNADLTMDNEL
ncbi:hypothetical protein AGABI1DRAFT_36735 [Agaricus bisporus var. burnettii JB137-S8]|uniref:Uncharacterized protein n=1 Tax=Agaricus bisporus var. burnettii (strain JB137-S8 / ATCC MYA-4627 / FGSC 10392) TaxID=597362 RepID=K5WZB4_AGABU|nr:uncharacterized protein AGABI1DRAFT_36735 [Agaricus bisporus var. burnettii JB137-S8]EKM80881.1 hypothetical protein AGABI1DRAFT_36735 [Agaricus bisporus var. burnettii JB137-S8]